MGAKKAMRKLVLLVSLLVLGLMMISPVLGAYDDGCSCHKNMEPTRDESAYLESVHGTKGISCTQCHTGFDEQPHPQLSVDCDNVECHSKGYTVTSNWVVSNHDAIVSETSEGESGTDEGDSEGEGEESEEEESQEVTGEEETEGEESSGAASGSSGAPESEDEESGEVESSGEAEEPGEITGESGEAASGAAEETKEDEETPGFSITLAIMGILAVAFLIKRR